MISKRIILPLLIVVILSGIGGVFAAQKWMEYQLNEARKASQKTENQFPVTDLHESENSVKK